MNQRPRRRPNAFTLIELLTVIAIIGILAAIIIPTLGKVRESARRAQTISKVRQAIIATLSYGNENKGKPPHTENNGQWGSAPHVYAFTAYDETLKPYLGDRFTALYCSPTLAQITKYNPDTQRALYNSGGTAQDYGHLSYFQRNGTGSTKPKDKYKNLFKDLNTPPLDYALWGTLTFKGNGKTLAYAEANEAKLLTISGMFAGYADASVKWFKLDQLSTFDDAGCHYWPKPKNE
ncbi:prepilin-type N-terminal cleavage/methylation domain-containing protein [Opitutaceae bacterium TAV4]|nr:prepilin-type N-terminal cleavage/methylation domain-containing protein [Opitutaceae bacterium TAV4]RRK00652.1 prepilin-type N-terminal cleavage/methylation domain-containing protein [Opitutaceae bacterium TAV3]